MVLQQPGRKIQSQRKGRLWGIIIHTDRLLQLDAQAGRSRARLLLTLLCLPHAHGLPEPPTGHTGQESECVKATAGS